ncbi:MAG TPA: RNA polymerase sigma factor [Candidatus Paceibacterota bacterium]
MTLAEKTYFEILLNQAHTTFKKDLQRYALSKIGNKALSEDLVQDTFVKTWAYLAKGGKILFMRAFLYRILNNLIVDEYRKRKTVSLDAMFNDGFEPAVDDAEALMDAADGKRALEVVNELPEKYQSVMSMRFEKDMSLEEISAVTGQSKNSITVQVHRGLKKIKSIYENRDAQFAAHLGNASHA